MNLTECLTASTVVWKCVRAVISMCKGGHTYVYGRSLVCITKFISMYMGGHKCVSGRL